MNPDTPQIAAMRTELSALEGQRQGLLDMAALKGEEIHQIKLKLITAIHNVRLGSIVRNQKGEYLVTAVDERWPVDEKPWLKGRKKTKAGEWGQAQCTLYKSWTLVEPHSPQPPPENESISGESNAS